MVGGNGETTSSTDFQEVQASNILEALCCETLGAGGGRGVLVCGNLRWCSKTTRNCALESPVDSSTHQRLFSDFRPRYVSENLVRPHLAYRAVRTNDGASKQEARQHPPLPTPLAQHALSPS